MNILILLCLADSYKLFSFFSRYLIWRRCECKRTLEGKLIIITGATSGIGLATATELAKKSTSKLIIIYKFYFILCQFSIYKTGASLILACRDTKKANEIAQKLITTTGNHNIVVKHLDLSSLASVATFAQQFETNNSSIYALINNAGIFYAQPANTIDDIEITFQTNYLGPFLLTVLLLPALRRHITQTYVNYSEQPNRIIFLSSEAHLQITSTPCPQFHAKFEDTPQNRFAAYQYSKLYLVLFAHRLNRLLEKSSNVVTVHCVDPGNTETPIFRTFPQLSDPLLFAIQKPLRLFIIKTPYEAAQSILHIVLTPNPKPPFYIKNLIECNNINYHAINDRIQSDVLWTISRNLCAKHLKFTI